MKTRSINKCRKILGVVLILLLFTITAHAKTYYVDTRGDDLNKGTSLEEPFRKIQTALDKAAAGDTVRVRGGSYKERLVFKTSGKYKKPIQLLAYHGEKPLIDGSSMIIPESTENGYYPLISIEGKTHITIRGLQIAYLSGTKSSVNVTPVGIYIASQNGEDAPESIKILGNSIHDIECKVTGDEGSSHAIAVMGRSESEIRDIMLQGNTIYNCKLGWSEAIAINGNVKKFKIIKNEIFDIDNIAIDCIGHEKYMCSDSQKNQARDGLVSENIISNVDSRNNAAYGYEQAASGIYIDGGKNIIIEKNKIRRANYGITISSEAQGMYAKDIIVRSNQISLSNLSGILIGGSNPKYNGGVNNCKILNNSLFGNDTNNSYSGEIYFQNHFGNIYIHNNILFPNNATNGKYLTIVHSSGIIGNEVSIDNNIYWAPKPNKPQWVWADNRYTELKAYQNGTGFDFNSIVSDPEYVNANVGNLHIRSTSPANENGSYEGLGIKDFGTKDIDNEKRIMETIDIGADEIQ